MASSTFSPARRLLCYNLVMPSSRPKTLDACVDALRHGLQRSGAGTVPAAGELRAGVESFLGAARESEPQLEVSDVALMAYVARRLEPSDNPVGALESLHSADLRLACACAAGDGRALAAFDHRFATDLRRVHARAETTKIRLDDFVQALREKLFVSPQRRIEEYGGRAPLRSWVRVVATRTLLDLARPSYLTELHADENTFLQVPAPGDDPDVAFAKRLYGAAVLEAVQEAARDLSPQERNVLREHYARGLSIDQIGRLHRVHRATAARRVQRARELLVDKVRALLVARFKLSGRDLESVLRLLRSAMHITLERVLD